MAALPGRGPEPPIAVQFTVPAHLSLLTTIRTGVGDLVHQVGGSATCAHDLQLAADEVVAVLIADSSPWSDLTLVIAHDEEDVYVRVSTVRAQPRHALTVHDLTTTLLTSVVESSSILTDGDRGYAFLQTPQGGSVT
ncbi:MAG: hypothetical protein JJT89_16745 [Nitriliruptoraceae bacterium]|nr:hypothetical protein [Nitriliruptoraceae bacterium]